jgi:peptidoglycan hydrolase-like protein with peptidoglycan-binding domain
MRSLVRRVFAGMLGLVAVAMVATLVGAAAPARAAVSPSATPAAGGPTHDWTQGLRWPYVRPGNRGERVVTVQYLLNQAGYRVPVTGFYGSITTGAVKAFQRSRGLNPSGNVGPSSWDRLIVTLRFGNSGPAVRAVQHSMRFVYGFQFQRVTGFFGTETLAVVKAFQRGSRLPVTGVVNPQTWMTIVWFEP